MMSSLMERIAARKQALRQRCTPAAAKRSIIVF
jgi:hypothetical protein